ncbi:MAG: substrate-binding domain-containing protein [Lachnospiraceae bacterium]|nr:substrate-binding domain-containing protein [Lachnospiraceae bacterium]
MKMKRLITLIAMIVTMGFAIAGCGNKGNKEFDSSNEITVVSREDGSGTRGAFVELFGIEEKDANGEKIDHTTEEANITNSTSVMMTSVAGNIYAIGYISLGSLNDSVKALKIDGAEATADNIKKGLYKVSRPFNIATKGDVSKITQDFINYIMSIDGQKVVTDNGYIAIDGAKAFKGTKPEGKIVIAGSSSVTPVMEKLKEAYLKVNTKAEIEIQQSDSTTGMTSIADGICDIGMASRELKDTESEKGIKATAIALDGIVVIVSNDSTMDELSSDQVKSIFTGEALTWDEVIK